MSKKIVNYNVIGYEFGDDYQQITASKGVTTNDLIDLCGHKKITLGCDGTDCGNSGICDDPQDSCCTKRLSIYGDTQILKTECSDGTLFANKIEADSFVGNGSNITNTDDTKVTKFEYDGDFNILKLTQKNDNNENSEQSFIINADKFTKNTQIISFGYDQENSNLISLKDSDGSIWKVDLSKYDDSKEETYISKGSCDEFGNIKLSYNQPNMQNLNIDISDAILNLEHYITEGYVNDKTLVLKMKNGSPIVIPLHDLIYDLKYREDKYIAHVEWCGDELIMKRSDGVEFRVSFIEIISHIIENNVNNVVGGCVNQDNEIVLYFEDGATMTIGKVTTKDTYITTAYWKAHPQYPNDPYKLTLRLNQSDETYIDIKFGELLSRIRNDNTYLIDGEIYKDTITLKNNDGSEIKINGLVNSDTKVINGSYNYIDQEIILKNSDNKSVKIPISRLIEDCHKVGDKYLKNIKWMGDTLVFDVEGHGELLTSFNKYKNIDQSIKTIEYDSSNGVFSIENMEGKKQSVSGFLTRDEIKNISDIKVLVGEEVNYLIIKREDGEKWSVKLPDASLKDGEYLAKDRSISNANEINLTLTNGKQININNIENTFVNNFTINGDTLKLGRNDGQNLLLKLTPLLDIASNNDKIIDGEYNNGLLTLKTKNSSVVINDLPLHLEKEIKNITLSGIEWNGTIDYVLQGDSMMINLDIVNVDNTSTEIYRLPFEFPFDINKVVCGYNQGGLINVPIIIRKNGIIELIDIIPDAIKDSFTIIK